MATSCTPCSRRRALVAGVTVVAAIGCSDSVRPSDPAPATALSLPAVASSREPAQVRVGDTARIDTRFDATRAVWAVRNEKVLALLTPGSVLAIGAGQSYVVARATEGWHVGEQDSGLVIVSAPTSAPAPPPVVDSTRPAGHDSASPPTQSRVASLVVTLPVASLSVGSSTQASVVVYDAGGRALAGRAVTWTATNAGNGGGPMRAAVSPSGLVTGVAPGDVRINATSEERAQEVGLTITATVKSPGTGLPSGPVVTLSPGQSIQSAVTANAAGTVFVLAAGTYQNQRIVPKAGDVFYGQPGAVLDGTNTTKYAFDLAGTPYPDNVRIHGLTITRYAPDPYQGAIHSTPGGRGVGPRGWMIDSNEVSYNLTEGLLVPMKGRVLSNYVHHNGQEGMGGNPDSALVENNEVAFNNPNKQYSMGDEAGGIKLAVGSGNVVRNNYVHDNWGAGIWFDIDMTGSLVEGNRVENNADAGIFYEISYNAVIRNNTVRGNGFGNAKWLYGAGIFVSSSKGVEVYGNTVSGNARGITAVMQARGSGTYGLRELADLYVHDNVVTMLDPNPCNSGSCNQTGLSQDIGDKSYFTSKNNRFVRNSYTLGSAAGNWFTWNNRNVNAAGWRGGGQDTDGIFTQ